MELQIIPLELIKPPRYILRPVLKATVAYQEMLDSIRDNGLWQPILVRPVGHYYEVVDGFYRFSCCKDLRFKMIPCIIRIITDDEILWIQIQTNAIRPETKPVEFLAQIESIMQRYPDLNIPRLSILLRKSIPWLENILSLKRLRPKYLEVVKSGNISLTNAYELARLPKALQDSFIEPAIKLPVKDFKRLVRTEVKKYREKIHRSFLEDRDRIKPVPYFRRYWEVVNEYEKPSIAGKILEQAKAKTIFEAWKACLSWVLHLDSDALIEQEKMIEKRKEQEDQAIKRRKQDRRKLEQLRKKMNNEEQKDE